MDLTIISYLNLRNMEVEAEVFITNEDEGKIEAKIDWLQVAGWQHGVKRYTVPSIAEHAVENGSDDEAAAAGSDSAADSGDIESVVIGDDQTETADDGAEDDT